MEPIVGVAGAASVVISSAVAYFTARFGYKQSREERTEKSKTEASTAAVDSLLQYNDRLLKRVNDLENQISELQYKTGRTEALQLQVDMLNEAKEDCEREVAGLKKASELRDQQRDEDNRRHAMEIERLEAHIRMLNTPTRRRP